MTSAMIWQWKGPVPGREAQALALFSEVNDFYGKLIAEGKVDSAEWFLGTFGADFFIVKGEEETLLALPEQPDLRRLIAKTRVLNEDVQYGFYRTGQGLEAPLQAYTEALKELGYM